MLHKSSNHGISELTLTEILALPYSDVVSRVRTGEWEVEQFTQWIEDRLNYAFGDGYEEGYTTAEEQAILSKAANLVDANKISHYN